MAARYLQATAAPVEIRSGADDESEMGLWSHVHQPQRESFSVRIDEFLPSGSRPAMSMQRERRSPPPTGRMRQ